MGNLLGEPFKDYVDAQINVRQDVHGKANRNLQELQYLNSKNAWIKLASGTSFDESRIELLMKGGNPLVSKNDTDYNLAIKNVLFNGLTGFGESVPIDLKGAGGISRTYNVASTSQTQREGITGANRAYGVGGTQQHGYSPMPGIIDANIKDLNRGSIKKATINIKAHNRNQFDVIDALYLRLGYSVMLEWGVDKYLSSPTISNELTNATVAGALNTVGTSNLSSPTGYTLENMGTTLIDKKFWTYTDSSYNEILPAIEELRKKYQGNYDGMFGVISNFSWTFEADGTYNIKLEIMSQGDVIESLKANLPKKNKKGEVVNQYDKLARARAAETPAGDVDSFFALYPGLEQIIEDWYKGVKEYKSKFSYSITPNIKFGGGDIISAVSNLATEAAEFELDVSLFTNNFPTLNLKNYLSDRSTNSAKQNIANITQALELDRYFTQILNTALIGIALAQEATSEKVYTSRDYEGNKTILLEGDSDKKNEYNGWNTKGAFSDSYLQNAWDASKVKAEAAGIDEDTFTRRFLIENITLDLIKLFTFKKYQSLNYAGGSEDPQFKTEVDEDATEEEKAEAEAEQEVENELEAKKDKNKINNYLYRVRNVWGGLINGEYKYVGENAFGEIKVGNRKLGVIQNPTGTNTGKFKPIWNREVKFPTYPRANAGQSITDQLETSLLGGSRGDLDSTQPNAADFIKLDLTPINKQHFIRLGVFLEYLEKNVIPKIKTGSKTDQPMLLIDYHPENNICYTIDNVISLDLNKTLVKNPTFFNGKEYEGIFTGAKDFKRNISGVSNGPIWGNIMNIYINFARIEELFENVDEENEVSVFSILKNLATDINESLGNINNIEPIIDKETNTVKFIDQTSIPGLEDIAKKLNIPFRSDKSSVKLEIFGLNPTNNTSNFVRSAGITTEISKEYATMITIGATANGAIPGAEATAFSKWNIGITDRFKTNIVDGEAEREATLEEQNQSVLQQYVFMIERENEKLGLTRDTDNKYIINDEVISTNKDTASNYYTYAQAETSNAASGSIESSIGFLPFNLKLSMDGLSGIKIYNKVNVNTSFLPSNYGDTLSFIITGVNHKLSGNEWVTNLDTIATSKNKQT